jgi:hypothetical protein
LAIGHVNSRQSSPLRTSEGFRTSSSNVVLSIAQMNMLATHARRTTIVVVTSRVPILNHGSLALRRSGTENEKRPAMTPNRILDI